MAITFNIKTLDSLISEIKNDVTITDSKKLEFKEAALKLKKLLISELAKSNYTDADVQYYANLDDLKRMLAEDTVIFKYTKKDGTEKIAKGTTDLSLIPLDKHPVTELNLEKIVYGHLDTAQKYFDLDQNEWRSFVKTNLIVVL